MKLNSLNMMTNIIIWTKQHAAEWENFLIKYLSNKGLLSIIYKKFKNKKDICIYIYMEREHFQTNNFLIIIYYIFKQNSQKRKYKWLRSA